MRRIEKQGTQETAKRTLHACGRILRYAVATGRADRDFTPDLKGVIAPIAKKRRATLLEPRAIGGMLAAIDGYEGSLVTRAALKLAPLVFVRPGELRQAEWKEFDLEKPEWRIPAERMKMKITHLVPLARQAVALLEDIQPLTGHSKYVFPSELIFERPMSDNTLNSALKRLGYQSHVITPHGFRAMASTLLNEQRWNRDAIERQLAHIEQHDVRAAYNYADYLGERRKMMQARVDYLETLFEARKVRRARGPKDAAGQPTSPRDRRERVRCGRDRHARLTSKIMEVVMTHPSLAPLRYSLRGVEKLLGLSRSTLYTRIAEGKLAVHKDGRRTFVSAVELARYLKAQGASRA